MRTFSIVTVKDQCCHWLVVLAVLFLAGFVGGCATPPIGSSNDDPAWAARQQALARLNRWQAVGRIGVVSGQEGWHTHFQWTQDGEDYRIDLIGPLGQGRVLIQGNADEVRIQTQDGQQRTAPDPDSLVEQTLGVRLPVSGLRYWIRGLPTPEEATTLQTDADHRLTRLEQSGWVIDYPAYTAPAPPGLPERIVARRQDLNVKFVIERWTL